MINPLPIVMADIRRSRAGVLAVIALIAIAVALGVAVSCQERALRIGSARASDAFDLVIGARGSSTQLVLTTVYLQPALLDLMPGDALKTLGSDSGVVYAAPLVFGDSYRSFPVVGSTTDFVTRGGRIEPAEGRLFTADREVVVGVDVPLAVGERFTPVHGQPVEAGARRDVHVHGGFEYTVVGRMPRLGSPWDRAIVAPVEALWALHARPRGHAPGSERIGPPWDGAEVGGVSAVVVKPRSVADAYRLRTRHRNEQTMAVFPAEVLVELYGMLGDARDVLALIAVVTQVLVVLAVFLAVFASLAQRRRQLGVIRALGASRAYVFAAVWLHVTLLLVSGAVLGLALGWAGAQGLAALVHARTGLTLPVAIAGPEIAMTLALALIGAALAAIPSWRCYRQPVAASLRA